MHGSIRDRLEDLLAAEGFAAREPELIKHLSSCVECSSDLARMKEQSEALHGLRAPEDVEPTPGFYARVMQRIEERAKDSMWAGFIYSPFAKRLTYASLAIALLLGSFVIGQETRDGHLTGEQMFAQQFHEDARVIGSQQQQRDAVLANFALHQGPVQ
jgi:anti-sigma factor RsiW